MKKGFPAASQSILVAAPFGAQIARDDTDAPLAWAETLREPALRESVKERIASRVNAGR